MLSERPPWDRLRPLFIDMGSVLLKVSWAGVSSLALSHHEELSFRAPWTPPQHCLTCRVGIPHGPAPEGPSQHSWHPSPGRLPSEWRWEGEAAAAALQGLWPAVQHRLPTLALLPLRQVSGHWAALLWQPPHLGLCGFASPQHLLVSTSGCSTAPILFVFPLGMLTFQLQCPSLQTHRLLNITLPVSNCLLKMWVSAGLISEGFAAWSERRSGLLGSVETARSVMVHLHFRDSLMLLFSVWFYCFL